MSSRPLMKLWSRGRLLDALLLSAFVLVHLVVTVLWLRDNHMDLDRVQDELAHYWGLTNLHTAMSLDPLTGALNSLRATHINYPLVTHLPRAVAGLLFGGTPLVFCAANALYLTVLLVSVYGIGVRCHGRAAGLLAAGLASLMPAAYGGMRSVGLDFPVTCMTALAMLALLRAEGFRRLPAAAGFGVCAGLAILIKGQAALFLFWPAAAALVHGLWQQRRDGDPVWRPLAGGALAVALLLGTTAVWWLGRLGPMAAYLTSHSTGQGMRDVAGDISLWGGVVCYLKALPLSMSAPLALGALLALPLFLRRGRHRWEILAWLVAPLALHMALSVRHARYIYPLLPAAAVLLAVGLCTLRSRLQAAAAVTAGALAVAGWLSCTYLQHPTPGTVRPLRCYFEIPPELVKTSDVLNSLLACGTWQVAGSPSPPQQATHHRTAAELVRHLSAGAANGEEILIYADEVDRAATTALQVRRALPTALFLDTRQAGLLLPNKPDHRRLTFVLWAGHRPAPPAEGAAHVAGPLPFRSALGDMGQMSLYRFDGRATAWPHIR